MTSISVTASRMSASDALSVWALLWSTLSSQRGCWSSCILPRCVRKNLENGICERVTPEHENAFLKNHQMWRRHSYLHRCLPGFYSSADLDVLPVGSSPGVQEITVYVILLMREVLLCWDVDHPWAAISSHTQMQRVKTGPIIMLFSLKWTLRQTKGCVLTCNVAVVVI